MFAPLLLLLILIISTTAFQRQPPPPIRISRQPSTSTSNPTSSSSSFTTSDATLADLIPLVQLANAQFSPSCKTLQDKVQLIQEILRLFVPKLVAPRTMGHAVIAVRTRPPRQQMVGFVDLSLQPATGSMDALLPLPLQQRKQLYNDQLEPYLCNLLVSPVYRKQGLGLRLVVACEDRARRWGCNTVNLHVERDSVPAFSLYLKAGFQPVQSTGNIIFMKKKMQ